MGWTLAIASSPGLLIGMGGGPWKAWEKPRWWIQSHMHVCTYTVHSLIHYTLCSCPMFISYFSYPWNSVKLEVSCIQMRSKGHPAYSYPASLHYLELKCWNSKVFISSQQWWTLLHFEIVFILLKWVSRCVKLQNFLHYHVKCTAPEAHAWIHYAQLSEFSHEYHQSLHSDLCQTRILT